MKKILIIDDEAEIRNVFQEILQEEGYKVSTAGDGAEGLTRTQQENFDLIILDKKMPVSDGVEFITQLQSHPLPSKILLISGSPSCQSFPGISGYLSKPCEIDDLISSVKKLIPD